MHLGKDWNMLCLSEEGAGPHGQNWRGLAGWAEGPCRQRAQLSPLGLPQAPSSAEHSIQQLTMPTASCGLLEAGASWCPRPTCSDADHAVPELSPALLPGQSQEAKSISSHTSW